jgi:hypothetical protein
MGGSYTYKVLNFTGTLIGNFNGNGANGNGATASAGRNTRWTRVYSIGTGNREFWMHLWRMFSKKEFEGKG